MEEHAGSVAHWLDENDEVVVVTRDGLGTKLKNGRMVHGLTGNLSKDAAIVRSQPVDCWLAMSGPHIALAPMIAAPMFGYVHGLDILRPWTPHQFLLERAVKLAGKCGVSVNGAVYQWRRQKITAGIAALRGLYTNSNYTALLASRVYGIAREAVTVIHPGVNEEFLTVPRRNHDGPFRLVLIARLEPHARRKNVDGVIRALSVAGKEVDAFLHVVGTGGDLEYLKGVVEELGISHRVVFEGALAKDKLKDLFAECDALIMAVKPHESDVEGFGMVYVEAACAGLPSIAVNVGGVSEAVEDGKTGKLLDDASLESIAAAIIQFAQNRRQFDTDYIRAFGRARTSRETTRRLREHVGLRLAGTERDARKVGVAADAV